MKFVLVPQGQEVVKVTFPSDDDRQCDELDEVEVRGIFSLIAMYNEKIDALQAVGDGAARANARGLIRQRDELVRNLTGLTANPSSGSAS